MALTNRQAYAANVTLAFDNNGVRQYIESEKIIYIMIEHDYENQVLPVIYISLSVTNELYADIIKYKESAKFYLNISKSNLNSVSSVSKNCISGLFSYIPSNNNPNFREELSNNTFLDDSYKRIMIGLVSVDLTNKLRKSFNGLYSEIDQNTLVGIALEGTDCVIESLTYNETYQNILIPPVASRYRLLDYIFKRDNFYDTNFRYFMDFERSYLTSKCGNPVDSGDGQLSTTIVDIRSVTEQEAYYDGIEVRDGAYYIYVNPSNSNVILNEGLEKVANQIVSVDEDIELQTLDLEVNRTIDSETKQMFIREENAALYKNELETNTVIVEILKQHIDGSPFTPNKCIVVNNYGEYSKYDGKYLLVYKREFYKCVAGQFVMSCNVGLKKIGNIEPAKVVIASKKGVALSPGSKKSSTASKKKTLKSVKATTKSKIYTSEVI